MELKYKDNNYQINTAYVEHIYSIFSSVSQFFEDLNLTYTFTMSQIIFFNCLVQFFKDS